ncbi:Lipase/vitellogenin [Trinorchestia longiramus]|nr:Lipase/vitellogenin [Trinorchestia longiramus]
MQWPMIGPFYHKFISFFGPDDVQSTFRARSGKLSSDFSEKKYCFGAIGCFTVSRDFYHPVLRPLNIPPMSREKVNANFTLFTRSQAEGVVISPSNLNAIWNTTFNPDRPTKVIIHGWLETPEMQWTEDLASALLKKSDYNVIGVKWNSSWFYVFLLLNTLVVALEVASLLSWLSTNMAVDMGDVHIIGFSLGAQIAGYIGERTPGLGRITGLDPARPQFQGMPPAVRLDPSDALFVDVIHTDTSPDPNEQSVLGTHQLSGHVDFFPNGGADQPGCDFFRPPDFFACSHNVAQKMIVATVSNTCPFLAFPCDSYRSFKAGKCFSCDGPVGCAPMGIDADTWRPMGRKQVAMYLTTTGHPHYCLYHYRFTFHLPKSRHVGNSVRGHLRVTLMKGNARLNTFQITKRALRFIPGTSRSFLLRHEEDYSSVDGMLLSWRAETWPCKVGCGTALTVSHVSFTPLDNISVLMGNSSSVTMCDPHQPSLTVRTGRTAALRASSTCPRS